MTYISTAAIRFEDILPTVIFTACNPLLTSREQCPMEIHRVSAYCSRYSYLQRHSERVFVPLCLGGSG